MPSIVRLLNAPGLAPTAPYSYAATAPANARYVFLAGACPLDTNRQVVSPGDFSAQAIQCLGNLRIALQAAGATIEDVISTRVLVVSSVRADLSIVWDEVESAFGDHSVPSTLLGVTVLGYPDQLVEIEALAVVVD